MANDAGREATGGAPQELAAKRLVCIIYVLYVMYTCLFEPMWGMHTTCVHSVVDESIILYAIIIMEEVLP